MVEAIRIGTIFAHDQKQYRRWQSRQRSMTVVRQRGLTGAALERAILAVGRQFPDNVVREVRA